MNATSIRQDAETLQGVLTRYVDSRDGYKQAAELMPEEGLQRTFRNIARRREVVSSRLADLIRADGTRPDVNGSPEAGVHRWWIRLRDSVSSHETEAIIKECLRGEKELSRTLQAALEGGDLSPDHISLLAEAIAEVDLAVRAFELVADDV